MDMLSSEIVSGGRQSGKGNGPDRPPGIRQRQLGSESPWESARDPPTSPNPASPAAVLERAAVLRLGPEVGVEVDGTHLAHAFANSVIQRTSRDETTHVRVRLTRNGPHRVRASPGDDLVSRAVIRWANDVGRSSGPPIADARARARDRPPVAQAIARRRGDRDDRDRGVRLSRGCRGLGRRVLPTITPAGAREQGGSGTVGDAEIGVEGAALKAPMEPRVSARAAREVTASVGTVPPPRRAPRRRARVALSVTVVLERPRSPTYWRA